MEHKENRSGLSLASVTFVDLAEIILKHSRAIATITVVAAVATAVYTLFLPNIYSARAKILPSQQQAGFLSGVMMQGALATIGGDIVGESKTSKLYAEMLKTDSIRDVVIDRFKLMDVYKKQYRQDTYKVLNNVVSIQVGKEGIITITVDDKDPKRATDMANAFAEELQRMTVDLSAKGAGSNRAFLEDRIAKSKEDLTASENALKEFQLKHKALNIPQQAEITVREVAELNGQLTAQEMVLANLRRTLTDSSQEVKTAMLTIASIKAKIARLEGGTGGGTVPLLGAVPELGQEYLHLMRRFKTDESMHDLLVRQYEMARLTEANNVSTIQIIQKARVPDRKSKPQRALKVMMAAVTAFFFSILYAFALDYVGRMPDEEKQRCRDLRRYLLRWQ
jgi:uncharacterized protein involved in exopolysaccharide biosynthesis